MPIQFPVNFLQKWVLRDPIILLALKRLFATSTDQQIHSFSSDFRNNSTGNCRSYIALLSVIKDSRAIKVLYNMVCSYKRLGYYGFRVVLTAIILVLRLLSLLIHAVHDFFFLWPDSPQVEQSWTWRIAPLRYYKVPIFLSYTSPRHIFRKHQKLK
jgi:hypothetical protein